MPYNSETETFYQAPATVVDSTPDGDTVQEGFDDRLTPAMAGLYADLNLLKADGMISVGIPATTTARGIGRVATSADLVDGATINNGPAFLAAGVHTSVAAVAGKVPVADSNGKLDSWVQQTQFATCATAAATAAKEATLTGFSLVKGARVFVIFSNANTVADAITLNVNGTGAKAICDEAGQAVSSTNPAYFPAGCRIEFIYDGINWVYSRRVVKSYVGASSWYYVRSDGWIKQGWIYTNTQTAANGSITAVTQTLPIPHKNTNYDVKRELLISYAAVFSPQYAFLIGTKTTTSITSTCDGNYITSVMFTTEGF